MREETVDNWYLEILNGGERPLLTEISRGRR